MNRRKRINIKNIPVTKKITKLKFQEKEKKEKVTDENCLKDFHDAKGELPTPTFFPYSCHQRTT